MTMNRKMSAPKEMATERSAMPMTDTVKARKRMSNIVATPAEVDLYCYDPNGARENKRPGIPCEDYSE